MSKSVGNVVDPFTIAAHYGVDQVRYFFMREVSFGQDGVYSHEAIVNRINADLANDLGNLAQRSLSMIGNYADGVLPTPGAFSAEDNALLAAADELLDRCRAEMDQLAIHLVLTAIWQVVADANRYFAVAGALGASQNRSGADGDRALRHGGGRASGRDLGPADHAGVGGADARSRCCPSRCAKLRTPRRGRTA